MSNSTNLSNSFRASGGVDSGALANSVLVLINTDGSHAAVSMFGIESAIDFGNLSQAQQNDLSTLLPPAQWSSVNW